MLCWTQNNLHRNLIYKLLIHDLNFTDTMLTHDPISVCCVGHRTTFIEISSTRFLYVVLDTEQVAVLKGHSGLVKGVTWDPVGKYLASQVSKQWNKFLWNLTIIS